MSAGGSGDEGSEPAAGGGSDGESGGSFMKAEKPLRAT
jgi:hypothetical protein